MLATGGDTALGGDDLDAALADWVLQQCESPSLAPGQYRQLQAAARASKERLSDELAVDVDLTGVLPSGGVIRITRETFDGLIQPLVKRTLASCRRCLRDAELDADIDNVVMVGGSTRVPCVREAVADFFHRPPLVDIDPDQVVALGAAIQADILVGNRPEGDLLLLDVIPLSLGIETMGALVEKIVPRNTTIPVSRAQEFTTYKDGQTALAIHIVQGEREIVSDCRSLAHFELRGIPPMVAGAARIKVTFQVDADGLLNVSAREEITGSQTNVTIKPSFGLTDDEITTMLQASFSHAAEDKLARQLAEERLSASQLLEGLQSAMSIDGEALLSNDDRESLVARMIELEASLESEDADAIHTLTERLGRHSEAFASRRMDKSIREALAGMSLDALDDEVMQ